MKRAWLLLLCSCATLADGTPGLDNPPGARAGPFRVLRPGELGQQRVAPNAISDNDTFMRDPCVVDLDGDPVTREVEAYFAANEEEAGPDAAPVRIVRSRAIDGRSFDRSPEVVLEIDQPWQGARLGAPSVVIGESDERLLFYESEGGIGRAVATAASGVFESDAVPVLSMASLAWAESELRSPGVVMLQDGTFRLYFETSYRGQPAIGVATSSDGATFLDGGVVLTPSGRAGDPDGAHVGGPQPVLATSSEGREILYLYFTAQDLDGKQGIGLAARFLEDEGEALDRSPSAMYAPTGDVLPREPSVIRFDKFTFLFTTQRSSRDNADPIVVVGVSPGDIELPEPEPL